MMGFDSVIDYQKRFGLDLRHMIGRGEEQSKRVEGFLR